MTGFIEAVDDRYRGSERNETRQILEEFIELKGYHRKHAIRVLRREPQAAEGEARPAATL